MTAWSVPDARRAIKLLEGEGYEVSGVEITCDGVKILTRKAGPAVVTGNDPGGEDGPEAELERKAKQLADGAARRA